LHETFWLVISAVADMEMIFHVELQQLLTIAKLSSDVLNFSHTAATLLSQLTHSFASL
jgi:hypothetical protein